jgi:hypothetical protein
MTYERCFHCHELLADCYCDRIEDYDPNTGVPINALTKEKYEDVYRLENPYNSKLVQSIAGNIFGPEWLYIEAMEGHKRGYKSPGYIFTLDSEDIE